MPSSPANSITVFVLGVFLTHQVVRDWKDHLKLLEELSTTDSLTGLHNRRWFFDAAQRQVELARRHGTPLALLFLDVDHFKNANDTHGHQAGDAALVVVAQQLKQCLRNVDLVARYGGEEFACLLTHTTLEGACLVAERCREAIAKAPVVHGERTFGVTVTVGVAACAGTAVMELDALLKAADDAMYRGKAAGRNRTVQVA